MSHQKKSTYLRRRIQSFGYALKGLVYLIQTEAHAQIHVAVAILVVVAGVYFRVSRIEWALLATSIAAVLAAEAFNTALEALTDLVSPEYHELAGRAKDIAAAAVLIVAIGAVVVGLLVFLPKLLMLYPNG
jgi:diacylglycerol kinase